MNQTLINTKTESSNMKFSRPKGTLDYYPEDKAILESIFGVIKEQARKFNFQQIESPVFEEEKLLKYRESEDTQKEIFSLEQKGSEKFALRFDMTVPAARMFCERQKELPKPVKWFYVSRAWRYERPQKGRAREFYQLSAECMGSDKPEVEIDLINMAIAILEKLGLSNKDFFININNRKLLQGLLQDLVVPEFMEDAIRIIDKREKIAEVDFFKLLKEIKVKDPSKIIEVLDLVDLESVEKLPKNKLAEEGFQELKAIYGRLDENYVRLSLSTARGLSYYTGIVFEVFDTNKELRAIAGGGRYDDMVGQFGGIDTPCAGFAMGMSTLQLLLEKKDRLPKPDLGPDYYIAPLGDKARSEAQKLAVKLRKKYSVDLDLTRKPLTKQINYASKIRAKQVIILGDKDLAEKKATVRNLKTGREKRVTLSSLK